VCVRLEGDGLMVEEFEMLPLLAAGCDFRRGTMLATTAQFTGGFFGSSPGLWWCSVMLCALLACVVCVVFASARYVTMLLLLI
jgi:hypothetical protein